ncbi:MAG: 3-phosphoshikimate 1-carboxyvinyltransferase [Dehalococcoidales bacterium]|nr:3-phosphoshikimate 1-carboxyvinyltransferase [Dehalococcoidales bacterium]
MKVSIHRSEVKGRVSAPPSKSYTIRGVMCAALARGESEIIHPLISDDTQAAINVLRRVGIRVYQMADRWQVSGGNFHKPVTELFCGESAATLRFMTAICSLIPGECRLTAGPSLSKRPIKPLVQALKQLGVNCSSQDDVGQVTVDGGKLSGGAVELPGNISSQFVSALLLISPFAEEGVKIKLTTPLESKPFVMMTLGCLERFGVNVEVSGDLTEFRVGKQTYQPAKYKVEGDWSSASYLLALGAVAGEVTVENINPTSRQGDRIMLDFLRDMGASVETDRDSVTVRKSKLKAIQADLSDCIDLLPTMAVLAAVADGGSEFVGIERARIKESDRVSAVREELAKMGIRVEEQRNRLTIIGSSPKGAVITPRDDHRVAMAFSIPGLLTEKTIINSAECVAKTFPQFWDILKSLGSKVEIDGE